MSTKSTIILTNDNEHWYEDCNGPYNQGTKSQSAIVLEFSPDHKVEQYGDGQGFGVIIEGDSNLYGAIMEVIGRNQISKPKQLSQDKNA